MQDWLRKIQANAQARLGGAQGRQPTRDLGRYKAFLKVETHRLKIRHRAGGGGLETCRLRAAVLDMLLKYLWEAASASLSEPGQKQAPALAVVALGGYGRGELNPHSDIDFMFLHNAHAPAGKVPPHFARMIDGLLYPLWDIGLKVGHSVRTLDDCIRVANSDMQSKTSLIEARLITGDRALFEQFEKTLVRKCVDGHEQEYIEMRLADQAARRAKFGNSAFMQEPNVKNGCGGLRDFQNLIWMTFFKYRTRSLNDLQTHEFIYETERRQLESAYDFLLRVRTEMHYHMNRGMDVLGKNLQPAVAYNLGYRERSPSLRIEGFMRDLYTHSRNIFLITRTVEQRLALSPKPRRMSLTAFLPSRRKAAEPTDGFRFLDGEIVAVDDQVFQEQPRRLMRVFLYAQQRHLKLHPDLAQLIRHQLHLVDRAFMADEHVRETFLAILNQRGNVGQVLRAMHEVDLLGKYIPEFGKLTCLVQHEFYHQYTADEHTLRCLEQLDRVWESKEPSRRMYVELFHSVERPFLLYLALLLHDVGKPEGHGHHTEVSTQLALRVAKRLRLDESATQTLQRVIKHHLLPATISQRRDLDDPAVIRHVARQVHDAETLRMLALHTFVDAQATSDKLWNGFKDSLLWTLFAKTLHVLAGGAESTRAEESLRLMLKEQVRRLAKDQVGSEEIDAHFSALPARYYQIRTPRQILNDLLMTHRFFRLQVLEGAESALSPVVEWFDDQDRGCSTVTICTWDRAGLFSKIAGCFSAVGLNILSAQVFTRNDGIVVDEFSAVDARTGNLAGPDQRAKLQEALQRVLTRGDLDFRALIARHKNTRPRYQAYVGERMPTEIRFDNETSEQRSIVEIETEDRLGLLYSISQALSELSLDICGAKISTESGAAIDSFYLRELDGGKITGQERRRAIEATVRAAISTLD